MNCQNCGTSILSLDIGKPQLSFTETVGGGSLPVSMYVLTSFAECQCGTGYAISANVTNIYVETNPENRG